MELFKVVVLEYINHINPFHFKFTLRPQDFRRERWMRPNWMGIEFNLLYRWHSLVPTAYDLPGGAVEIEKSLVAAPLLTPHGLKAFMVEMSRQPAGRVGLFNTAPFLVDKAEVPTVETGRLARLASYNAYRERYGFPPITKFEQLTTNDRVVEHLEQLYGDVDELEFYVGLLAEEAGPNGVLPPLMGAMVSLDAFSQILTNPLVGEQLHNNPRVFSEVGLEIIEDTNSIADIVARNVPGGLSEDETKEVSLTRRDFVYV
jgi:prostaglandin-endoperoxide synthase 2